MAGSDSKLSAALQAAARGIPVFRLKNNGKRPLFKGWQQEATINTAAIERLWEDTPDANIGWAMGHGFVAIDVDVKKEKQGDRTLFQLELANGDVPPTLTNATPTGGWHLVLKTEALVGNDGVGRMLGAGIDVRGEGGYVVGAGSTIDGTPYRCDWSAPLAEVPRWMAPMLRKPIERQTDQPVAELDTTPALARAAQYLQEQAPLANEGDGGDHTTFTVAAKLRDFAISEPMALDLMLEHWNDLCSPPWDPEELQRKVENAYRYASRAPGNASPQADFQPLAAPAPEPAKDMLRWPTAVQPFDFSTLRPPDWQVGHILARGYMSLLVAPPGAGKTKLTLALAVAAAAGKDLVLGLKIHKPQRVWVINGEDSMEDMRRNLAAAMTIAQVTWEDLHGHLFMNSGHEYRWQIASMDGSKKVRPLDQPRLIEACKANQIDILVIDPLINFHPCNENDNGQMGEVADLIRRIGWEANCGVMVVHHSRKRDKASPTSMAGDPESARGAQALTGAARIAVTLYGPSEKDKKEYGLSDEQAARLVRLDDGKVNLSAKGVRPHWFALESVLVNGLKGFEVGAVKSIQLEKIDAATPARDLALAICRVFVNGETIVKAPDVARRLMDSDPMYNGRHIKTVLEEFIERLGGQGVNVNGKTVKRIPSPRHKVAASIEVSDLIPTHSDVVTATQSDVQNDLESLESEGTPDGMTPDYVVEMLE